jgi:rhodanese-related sulfurtransferase
MTVPRVANWCLNVVLAALFAYTAWSVGNQFLWSRVDPSRGEQLKIGTSVTLANTDWAKNRTSLILVLSSKCPHCNASVPFYRTILSALSPEAVHVIAVFNEPMVSARAFLRTAGLDRISDIRIMNYRTLKVSGTPTLILADGQGKIISSWSGRLTESGEKSVFSTLGIQPATPLKSESAELPSRDVVSGAKLASLLHSKPSMPILDTRERQQFLHGHITGARNIPLDELEARVSHEIPANVAIAVDCHYVTRCESQAKNGYTITACGVVQEILQQKGYRNVLFIADDLSVLERAGIPVTRGSLNSSTLAP